MSEPAVRAELQITFKDGGVTAGLKSVTQAAEQAASKTASASVAALSIIPMQDVLGLDSTHRMNQPSQAEGSWEWRFSWNQVAPLHAERLAELTHRYGRIPNRSETQPLAE